MGVRVYPDTVRVYLDMDGPLADFELAAKIENSSLDDHKRTIGAYFRLPVTEGAHEALKIIMELGFEQFALTKIPSSNPHAATEKLLWVHKNLPELHDRVIISPDKGAVGRPCDILIDDHPEWANANNFQGIIIKFIPSEGWKPVIELLRSFADNLKNNADILKELHGRDRHYAIKNLFPKTQTSCQTS